MIKSNTPFLHFQAARIRRKRKVILRQESHVRHGSELAGYQDSTVLIAIPDWTHGWSFIWSQLRAPLWDIIAVDQNPSFLSRIDIKISYLEGISLRC